MVFGFFKRKKEKILDKSIENLNKKLTKSFSNLRVDMNNISQWIDVLDQRDREHQSSINKILARLDVLEQPPKQKEIKKEVVELEESNEEIEEEIEESNLKGLTGAYKSLTDTQKNLFKELYKQNLEKGGRWISQIEFAIEVYPDRPYSAVRTTLSDYLSILEDIGLVKRKRLNRKVAINITDLAKTFVKNAKKEFEKTKKTEGKQTQKNKTKSKK